VYRFITGTAFSKLRISYRRQTAVSSTILPPTVSLLLLFAMLIFAVFQMTARPYMFLPPERHVRPTATSLFQVYLPLGSAALLPFAVCLYIAHQLYNVSRTSTTAWLLHNIHTKITPKLTAVLSGHGMTKVYLHRFHLSEDAKCRCGNEYQSMDHILFHCESTKANREDLTKKIGTRPTSKPDLITKYQKDFSAFVESIDFDALQQSAQ